MSFISCFQDQICVYAALDCGDKRVDFVNDKVHDLIFFFTILKETEYFSVTTAQFSNRMDFRTEIKLWSS